ncbi:MAG: glycosyltransferase family protein [Myxococcota bacterium]|nr:glycosyltransferase family protein [Myxococcota bacterium]
MRILYGVVGEGMGHATRSRVVIEHLLSQSHTVRVVVSGRAHRFLTERLGDRPGLRIDEITGLHMVYSDNRVRKGRSLLSNLQGARAGIVQNLSAYRQHLGDYHPELVISDFESWSHAYARRHKVPVISLDNMQIINRCKHSPFITDGGHPDFRLARLAVKSKLPRCDHYLITTFFTPPIRKKRTTLVPPILRPEILSAHREPGEHILVYQTADANQQLLPVLQSLDLPFRVYGLNRDEQLGNCTLRSFSEQGFIDDLRTARGVIAGGGYSLMGEAVHLRVPMLSVPLKGQYEQQLNARYLTSLGYGAFSPLLNRGIVEDWLSRLDDYQQALMDYTPRDNQMLFDLLDELCERIGQGERKLASLEAPSLA